jgi:hypothetical protein
MWTLARASPAYDRLTSPCRLLALAGSGSRTRVQVAQDEGRDAGDRFAVRPARPAVALRLPSEFSLEEHPVFASLKGSPLGRARARRCEAAVDADAA